MTLPRGKARVHVSMEGFIDTFIDVVLEDSLLEETDIPLVPQNDGNGKLMAVARDATNKAVIPGFAAKLRPGVHDRTDNTVAAVSAPRGAAIMVIGAGTYTLELTKDGYYPAYLTVSIVAGKVVSIKDGLVMSPKMTGENRFLRVILTWDREPEDLDAHMLIPGGADLSNHESEQDKAAKKKGANVHWSESGSKDAPYYTILDVDDLDSFGPETMTVYKVHEKGTYHYYVHNFSEHPDIKVSKAKVEVYTAAGLFKTFRVPATGSGLFWDVFTMDGATMKISEVNKLTDVEPALPM